MKRPRTNIISAPPIEQWTQVGRRWQCPRCGKQYPRRGQGHSCVVVTLDDHFRNRPKTRELFDAFCAAVGQIDGDVRLSIAKTRIGLMTKITFAAVMPRKDYLRAHMLLTRKVDSRRFVKIEWADPYWVHHFEIHHESELDADMRGWLREASKVGRS